MRHKERLAGILRIVTPLPSGYGKNFHLQDASHCSLFLPRLHNRQKAKFVHYYAAVLPNGTHIIGSTFLTTRKCTEFNYIDKIYLPYSLLSGLQQEKVEK
jgi:hypothetical protein